MTKWIIFTCFFFISNVILAQKLNSDSLSLNRASQGILSREISFSHQGGKLEDVLSKLSAEQNIKFSYSHDRIQHVGVKEKSYSSVKLASLLTELLQYSGFNYLVVGRIIVIVEDDKNVSPLHPPDTTHLPVDSVTASPNTSVAFSDSSLAHSDTSLTSPLSGTNDTSKAIEDPNKPAVKPNASNHIYSPDINLALLPPSERRKIQKIYRKELKWAFHFNNSRDTLNKTKVNPTAGHYESKYYISGNLGIIHYTPSIKGNKEFSWNEDLNYHSNIKKSIRPEITFGFITRNLMLGTGVAFQQLKMKEEGMAIYKRSNGIGQGQGNQPDTFSYSYSDKYSVFSVPLEMFLFKQRKNLFAGIGSKLEVDFVHARVESDKFKTYYEAKVKDGIYSYKNNKIALLSSLKVQAGILVQNNMAMAVALRYNYYLTSFYKNSVISFYPNSLQFELSFFYFLNKSDIKKIVGRH